MHADQFDDPVLETLLLPIVTGRISWPQDGALFLRARDGWPLHSQPLPGIVCVQTFKPDADALIRAGFSTDVSPEKKYSLVLLLPPRQRDEARALMARAILCTRDDGQVVVCVANNEGARSSEADLRQLAGKVNTLSKNKCRVFWTEPLQTAIDEVLLSQWQSLDAPRSIGAGRFISRPGLFAWDRIDAASALLAEHLPHDLAGHAADLGAGFGYLATELLTRCAGIQSIALYEAEARALDLARQNLQSFESRVAISYYWHDVTAGLQAKYDVIVTNPPFHTQSRADRPDIGRHFIAAAATALKPNGRLWLVANRHLAYEQVLDERFGKVRVVAQREGFKVIEAIKTFGGIAAERFADISR